MEQLKELKTPSYPLISIFQGYMVKLIKDGFNPNVMPESEEERSKSTEQAKVWCETLFPVEQVIGICPCVVSSDKTAEQISVVVV